MIEMFLYNERFFDIFRIVFKFNVNVIKDYF